VWVAAPVAAQAQVVLALAAEAAAPAALVSALARQAERGSARRIVRPRDLAHHIWGS
jgi:hypothetical protein